MRAALPSLLVLATGCAGASWRTAPHDAPFQRVPQPELHSAPKPSDPLDFWTLLRYSTLAPLGRTLNPGHWVEAALLEERALDINAFGHVLDSEWFENRLTRRNLSPEALARGPNLYDAGPAEGPLLVLGGKMEGATPGLRVRDARGDEYLVKFDPAAFPELASGAEAIATRILWGAGYHVPQNYVVDIDLDQLYLEPGGVTAGRHGRRVPLTPQRVQDLVAHVNPFRDGTIRALFSKILPGRSIGPFSYQGQRFDDPNDTLPHERRRSLRGLWLLSAWLNNVDTRDANTLDVFLPSPDDPDRGHVKHFLIDFGDSLGSAGTKPKYPAAGYEGLLDWTLIGQSFFTLGLWYRYWLPVQRAPYREVGTFEAQVFDPEHWRPNIPNPAFVAADPLDTYWAAAIIARYDVEDLIAIVKEAKYTNPQAEAWILRVLLQRQYTILSWAFDQVLPLDRPELRGTNLTLEDLAVRSAVVAAERVGYEYEVYWARASEPELLTQGQNFRPEIDLGPVVEALGDRAAGEPFLTVVWRRVLPRDHGPAVKVHLRITEAGLIPVGLDREVR